MAIAKMISPTRYIFLVILIIITLHYILQNTHEGYGQATSFQNLADHLYQKKPMRRKASAAMVMLCRNDDIHEVVNSMKRLEHSFNKEYQYPWVFLNEEPFNEEFKRRTREMTDAPVEYGLIPREHWFQPDWIDEDRASAGRRKLVAEDIIYGDSVSYRNMCRFNSGFFYRHELLQKYKYYWRVEPGVQFFCDLEFDPFLYMQDNKKVYGFTLSLYEYEATIPTLWRTIKDFLNVHPDIMPENNAMAFVSDNDGVNYNLCHFWSNFEIGDLDFFRGERYSKFFEWLDRTGGFYYERWGDAPVHSIGVSLLARKDEIHFFNEIGYRHEPFQHCPQGQSHSRGKCACDESDNFDFDGYSCMSRYLALFANSTR